MISVKNIAIMKIAFVILIFISYVSAQSGSGFYDVTTWAENSDTNGGAIVQLPHPPLGNGSCVVTLPDAVELFHVSIEGNNSRSFNSLEL